MAIGNAKNIIVGAGAVYLGATTGTEYTEEDLVATGTFATSTATFQDPTNVDAASWKPVGYTSQGVDLSFEPDYGEVQVDQLLDVAKIFKQGQKVMIKTTLSEATLENLLITLGGKSTDMTGSSGSAVQEVNLNGGSLGYSPIERSIAIVGPGPDQKLVGQTNKKVERVYIGYRALSMDTVTVGVKRNEATEFPVTFRLLASTDNSAPDNNASYGKVIDRVY